MWCHSGKIITAMISFLSLSSPEYAPSTLYSTIVQLSILHFLSVHTHPCPPLFLPPPPPQHHHHYPYGKTGDHSIRCELLTPTEHSKARFWLQINTPKPAPDTNWTLPCQLLTSTEHFKVSCWLQLDTLKQTPDSRFEVNPPLQTPSTGLRHPSFNHCRI